MLIELKQVGKSYSGPDNTGKVSVLRDVNLQLRQGESLAIVGPSGSGKSTLLNIIGALDTPTQGEVWLDGQNLAVMNESKLAQVRNRSCGFIFQLHHLLPQCSVLENVLVPTLADAKRNNNAETRAHELLKRVGLESRINHRPGQLSGGECQRVAVVRALINQPKLLLADEPTGALDRHNAETLAQLLLEMNREQNVALVLVTHSEPLARRMERVCELRDGCLASLPLV